MSAIAHFTLAVRDVPQARSFFESALGWQPIERPGNIRGAAAWLEIAPGQEIHLLEVPEFQPSPFEREFGRHIALTFPLREFPWLRERLVAHGAQLIEAERPTPFQRFFFRDPQGYVFEIIEEHHAPETGIKE